MQVDGQITVNIFFTIQFILSQTGREVGGISAGAGSKPPRGPGPNRTIDFVIGYGKLCAPHDECSLIFLEVKYIKGLTPGADLKEIKEDADKLSSTNAQDILVDQNIRRYGEASKYILLIARHDMPEKYNPNSKRN